jgi:hypothetical protein
MAAFALIADFDRDAWVTAWAIWQNLAYGSVLAWWSIYRLTTGNDRARVKWVTWYSTSLLAWEITALFTGLSIDNEYAVAVAFGLLAILCVALTLWRMR